jgi:cytochrome c
MKSLFCYRQIMIVLLTAFGVALVQFACSFGAGASTQSSSQPASTVPQQIPSSAPQATQAPPAGSSEHGTPDEAMAMLQKAVAHYNSVGRAQALKDFTGRVTPFFDRDLYVACIDSHLVISANGGFPNLVGSAVEPLSRATWDAAASDHIGSVNYAYLNPVTKTTEAKTFYYEKVGSDVCGVGVYHP